MTATYTRARGAAVERLSPEQRFAAVSMTACTTTWE